MPCGTQSTTVVVGAFQTARAAVIDICQRIDFTTVGIGAIAISITSITGCQLTCATRTALRTVCQVTSYAAATAIGKRVDVGFTTIGWVAIAIRPARCTRWYAATASTSDGAMIVVTIITATAAVAHIRCQSSFTAVHSRSVTIGIAGETTCHNT